MLRLSGKNINLFNISLFAILHLQSKILKESMPVETEAVSNFRTSHRSSLPPLIGKGLSSQMPVSLQAPQELGNQPFPNHTPPLSTPHFHLSEQVRRCTLQLQLPIAGSWLLSLFIVLNLKITELPPFLSSFLSSSFFCFFWVGQGWFQPYTAWCRLEWILSFFLSCTPCLTGIFHVHTRVFKSYSSWSLQFSFVFSSETLAWHLCLYVY